ncbi:MAG: EAL domain-containing protein [Alphaproteobacteria bacterium]|nr:EAL domain-containing protein [Alphaproteobacteria bacterium]
MIAEQDFILAIRRFNRLNSTHTIVNVRRKLVDYDIVSSDNVESAIRLIVKKSSGEVFAMANGDLFLVMPLHNSEETTALKTALYAAMEITTESDQDKAITFYELPRDYSALRQRANVYVEQANASEHMGAIQTATQALQAHDVQGPLTAWSLSQVENLLDKIDIKRYVRTQPVYRQDERGVWEKKQIDFFIGISDLKRERLPRLILDTPERLFLELCSSLDRKLLMELTSFTAQWENKSISLNLSVETALSSVFAQFCQAVAKPVRSKVSFEIHRSELFLNYTTTQNALSILKGEGFNVGIDGITASVLPYINFTRMTNVDFYKINVSKDKWSGMNNPDVLEALKTLPAEKIIFSHCDHDEALPFGQKLGVRSYQGWLIDDVANAIIS